MRVYGVIRGNYLMAYRAAHEVSVQVRESCTPPDDMPADARYFLSDDLYGGFGITKDGELIGLWSFSGRGRDLVRAALDYGAWRLDCFDGFLPGYYESLGFREVRREPNWTPGEPDVVYMEV